MSTFQLEPHFSEIDLEATAQNRSRPNRVTFVDFINDEEDISPENTSPYTYYPNFLKLTRLSNPLRKTYICIISCLVVFILIGLSRFGLSIATLVSVWRAYILILFDFYTLGVCQVLSGAFLVCICIMAFRSLAANEKSMTSTGAKGIILALLFLMTLDIMVVFLSSRHLNDDFYSDVVLGMNDSLTLRYKGDTSSYTKEWNYLQQNSKCCGAENYTDWFGSNWAKGLRDNGKNVTFGILPLSCQFMINTNLPQPCDAILGSVSQEQTHISHLSLTNFTVVNICDIHVDIRGKDYIHRPPCAEYYYAVIYHELRAVMMVNLVFLATELILIYLMLKASNNLPNNHQVCVTNRNLPEIGNNSTSRIS